MTQPHSDSPPHLARRLLAEAVGAALFAAAVLGASLVGEQLVIIEPGSPGLALLAVLSGLGAALALYAIMTVLAPISGGYVNPIITFAAALRRAIDPWSAAAYMAAQYAGAALGVILIHAAFGAPLVEFSARRIGGPAWAGEAAAAFALAFLVYGVAGARASRLPIVTASAAAAVHFCTLSFSFGNPALTLARSFAGGAIGVSPADGLAILLVQLMASLAAAGLGAMVFGSAAMAEAVTRPDQPAAPARTRSATTGSVPPTRRSPVDPPVGDDSLKEQLAARLAAAKARIAREEAAERAYQQRKAAESGVAETRPETPAPEKATPRKPTPQAAEPSDAPPPRRRTAPPRAPKAPPAPPASPPPSDDGTYTPAPQAAAVGATKPAAPASPAPAPDAAAIEAQLEERRRMREKLRAERQAKADALRTEIQNKRKL